MLRTVYITTLLRYTRSRGVWLLLLGALLGARFLVPRSDGASVTIAVDGHLPVITSAMLGTSIGIMVTTLLLPFAFLYLRSNATRLQAWQVDEVTQGSRVMIELGRFLADVSVFASLLGSLTLAGWLLAWFSMSAADVHLWQIAVSILLVGMPSLMAVAGLRSLMNALPVTRRAFGEVYFFLVWMASLSTPMFMGARIGNFKSNLMDFGGALGLIGHVAPSGMANIQVGVGGTLKAGAIALDVWSVLRSPSYVGARLAWVAIAVAIAATAGLLYRPHRLGTGFRSSRAWQRWFKARPAPVGIGTLSAAKRSSHPFLGLLAVELRLIFSGRLLLLLSAFVSVSGFLFDYASFESPALFLVLIFALTAQADKTERSGLRVLTSNTLIPPSLRQAAFCLVGPLLSIAISLPALLIHPDKRVLLLAMGLGFLTSLSTLTLTALSGSAFAPRLLLIVLWFAYASRPI